QECPMRTAHVQATRVTMVTIAGCILLLSVSFLGAWFVHRIHRLNSQMMARDVANVIAAEELEIEMREIRNRLNRYLRTDESRFLEEIPRLREKTLELMRAVQARAQSAEEAREVAALEAGYENFFRRFQD